MNYPGCEQLLWYSESVMQRPTFYIKFPEVSFSTFLCRVLWGVFNLLLFICHGGLYWGNQKKPSPTLYHILLSIPLVVSLNLPSLIYHPEDENHKSLINVIGHLTSISSHGWILRQYAITKKKMVYLLTYCFKLVWFSFFCGSQN